jgi:site-specific DNA-methyltransferase (adenine-specific)
MFELRQGRWQEVFAEMPMVDAVICDPPYSAKLHETQSAAMARQMPDGSDRRALNYAAWSPQDVHDFVEHFSPRCKGWMVAMTDYDLSATWIDAYRKAGRHTFVPVLVIQDRVRLSGDGPASCAVYVIVARPKSQEYQRWGALPGFYKVGTDREGHIGGKPLELMRRLVTDYSREGDLVCDPCAGYGTTLVAAYDLGRKAIGGECDPDTFGKAKERLEKVMRQPSLFRPSDAKEQLSLLG